MYRKPAKTNVVDKKSEINQSKEDSQAIEVMEAYKGGIGSKRETPKGHNRKKSSDNSLRKSTDDAAKINN
jgi:hypothetical protein